MATVRVKCSVVCREGRGLQGGQQEVRVCQHCRGYMCNATENSVVGDKARSVATVTVTAHTVKAVQLLQ
jgi:hypothetical protein